MITKKARRKARLDSKQQKFGYTVVKKKKIKEPIMPKLVKSFVGDVLCPFCLHKAKLVKFMRSTKAGYHRTLGTCPSCQKGMQIKSLVAKWTPTEFAKWVFEYPSGAFWKKCTFKKFNKRLHSLGWSYEFWGAYKKLKPKVTEGSDYNQYLADMGYT